MRPMIDWKALLGQQGVAFIERGPNVKRGAINIRCPMCGSADPSFHMGLDLETGWWACWRNKDHRGKSPVRLLMSLLRVSFRAAREMAGLDDDYLDPEGFDSLRARLQGLDAPSKATKQLSCAWPASFSVITPQGRSRRHWNYLWGQRGFASSTGLLVDTYGLSFTMEGPQHDRIILPYVMNGQIVTWSGRAIATSSARYIDQPIDDAAVPTKHTLYNHDAMLEGGKVLVVVEGGFDALKIDLAGHDVGVRAVSLSTASISDDQAHLIAWGRDKFLRCIVMADQSVTGFGRSDSMKLRQALGFIPGLETQSPPFDLKDAGMLSNREAILWTDQLAAET